MINNSEYFAYNVVQAWPRICWLNDWKKEATSKKDRSDYSDDVPSSLVLVVMNNIASVECLAAHDRLKSFGNQKNDCMNEIQRQTRSKIPEFHDRRWYVWRSIMQSLIEYRILRSVNQRSCWISSRNSVNRSIDWIEWIVWCSNDKLLDMC